MTSDVADVARRFAEGAAHLNAGEDAAAERCFAEVAQIAPWLPEPHVNLGILYERRRDWRAAEASYQRALDLAPDNAEAHINLGNLLSRTGRIAQAELAYLRALQCDPGAPRAWCNLGVLRTQDRRGDEARRESEAEACYRQALSIDPGYVNARFALSVLLLRQGRFEEAWPDFDARFIPGDPDRLLPMPRWHGEPLAGRRVLVWGEGGYGDMIQFARYLPRLHDAGAGHVALLCQPGLLRLFGTIDGVDVLQPITEPFLPRDEDVWVPTMSLAGLLGVRADTIADEVPYLRTPVERPREDEADTLRVGLAWRGNPLHLNDAQRSLPHLNLLHPLSDVEGVRFVSLQLGAAARQVDEACPGFMVEEVLSPEGDFADTAAVVDQLDLVIAIDSAVAHLAGALGVPCFLLLPDQNTDWRWRAGRADTPWYPHTRLFRCGPYGDWEPVVAEVREALRRMAAAQRDDTARFSP